MSFVRAPCVTVSAASSREHHGTCDGPRHVPPPEPEHRKLAQCPLRRRHVMAIALAGPLINIIRHPAAAEADDAVGTTSIPRPTEPDNAVSLTDAELFETLDFSLLVPRGFELVVDAPIRPSGKSFAQERGERGRGIAQAASPVKAKFTSTSGQVISVIERESSKIKPTFLQLGDISQWGSAEEAASLLLPRGVKVLAAQAKQVEMPPRDTGTLLGVVQLPPQTIYRYDFTTPTGYRFAVAAAARAGKVYVAGASAPNKEWEVSGAALQQSIESFKLSPPLPVS